MYLHEPDGPYRRGHNDLVLVPGATVPLRGPSPPRPPRAASWDFHPGAASFENLYDFAPGVKLAELSKELHRVNEEASSVGHRHSPQEKTSIHNRLERARMEESYFPSEGVGMRFFDGEVPVATRFWKEDLALQEVDAVEDQHAYDMDRATTEAAQIEQQ